MSNKERIATNIKWNVDELDAVMHLCDLSDADCAYALNVDVSEFEAMGLSERLSLMKQTYRGQENLEKLYELLGLPTSISLPDNVCYIDSYLYSKYGYYTKSFDVEEKVRSLQKDWYFVVTSKCKTDFGIDRYHKKIMTFKGTHDEVEQKISELYEKYRCENLCGHTNGSGSASMDLYMDDDENPTQYTALISFASETVTIVAYDAENVEPLA